MSLGPVFPLRVAENSGVTVGYEMLEETKLEDILAVVKFHLKNILLSCPEERIMYPDFGACLISYLFEQSSVVNIDEMKGEIANQIALYAPYVNITSLDVATNGHTLSVSISYFINFAGQGNSVQDTFDILLNEFGVLENESELSTDFVDPMEGGPGFPFS